MVLGTDGEKILNYAWVICVHDLNYYGCGDKKFKEHEKFYLNRVTLILVSPK